MKTLKYRSQGNEVYTLEELLLELGYQVVVSSGKTLTQLLRISNRKIIW